MPRPVQRAAAVAISSLAFLCGAAVAHAQTADTFNPGANQTIWSLAVQPDGKILVGGGFTGLGGGTGTTTRNHIGRLNSDGTVDPTFNPGTNSLVYAIVVQPDGKILIGGIFSAVGGGTGVQTLRNRLARFNADGSVDLGFNPGVNGNVYALALQPDGKILVGGEFSMLGGGGTGTTTRNAIGRLNADGSLDSFNPGASVTAGAPIVYSMALQPDGKVVVGGRFNGLGGGTGTTVRNWIGRINGDGTIDSFNPGATFYVNAIALQADGKIVVGGDFTGLGGGTGLTLRSHIGRLESNGLVDLGFNPGAEAEVHTLSVQTDGRIVAGGYFKWLGDAGGAGKSTRNYIGRINSDGSVDGTFNPGTDNILNGVAVQADGAIIACGLFSSVGGPQGNGTLTTRAGIARFAATSAALQTLTLSGGSVTWARSGAGPEVSRVTFELSTGGVYTLLGAGVRVTGGWQLNGLTIPSNKRVQIRARGYSGTGYESGSGSIVESVLTQGHSNGPGDFDGDGKADITVYRPSNGTWYTLQSGASTLSTTSWGGSTDIPVAGDYDGDGKADIAVYRPGSGTWYILQSSTSAFVATAWGSPSDLPVVGDYDGDGKADIAVYRPSTGTWYILQSNTSAVRITAFGGPGDIPVAGDYDGDGMTDIAVFRPSTGTWYILQSSTSAFVTTAWGSPSDLPVVGDYDGDGKSDIAVFRPSTGTWFILQSSNSTIVITAWGAASDVPVPADFDGDGKTDIAVYRPGSGTWYILQSSTSTFRGAAWGGSTDIPALKRP